MNKQGLVMWNRKAPCTVWLSSRSENTAEEPPGHLAQLDLDNAAWATLKQEACTQHPY